MSSSLCVAEMDRELFSELREPPIQPALLHMEPLKIHGLDPNFHLHISCQLLWSWNNIQQTSLVFKALQANLFSQAYVLRESSAERIEKILLAQILRISNDLKVLKTRNLRQARKEKWVKILIGEDEVESMPPEVIQQLVRRIGDLEEENEELAAKLDEQGQQLYEAMAELAELKNASAPNKGKIFTEVGEKQQERQTEKIR